MAQINSFRQDVMLEVANCPGPVVDYAILNALAEFCKKSRYWVVDLDPVDIVAAQSSYAVASNVANTKVYEIYQIKAFGTDLDPLTHDELNKLWPNFTRKYTGYNSAYSEPWQEYTLEQPRNYHQPVSSQVLLFPLPNTAGVGALEMSAALYPATTITNEIPDEIYEEWRETIGFGAKARLMAQPGKDWFDSNASASNYQQFLINTNDARGRRARDFARNNKTTHRTRSSY